MKTKISQKLFVRKNKVWNSKHIEIMLELLTAMPLAGCTKEIDEQLNLAFNKARACIPDNKQYPQCPNIDTMINFNGLLVATTSKELIFFAKNGALAIMRNDDVISDDLMIVPISYTKEQILETFDYCYERAGSDGKNVWGEDFITAKTKAA